MSTEPSASVGGRLGVELTPDGFAPHVVAMVRRSLPVGCHVLPGSAPVVAFGDPRTAEVATLGINPSWAEFADADGQLLTGSKRRLPDAVSVGIEDFAGASDEQVQHIAAGCFEPDRVLRRLN